MSNTKDVLKQIAADMANDAKHFDGRPFIGRVVAEYFGNQGAAIAALAQIVGELLERVEILDVNRSSSDHESG